MRNLIAIVLTAAVATLSACGGDDGDGRTLAAIDAAAQAPQRMRALAVPVGADARLNAERLMDYAEEHYKDLFPNAEPTRQLDGWVYRYYPKSGVFLAVIDWRVYVVGGPYGAEVHDVGEVSSYISITPPGNQAPTVSLTLALQPATPTATLVLTATAADADGTITKVEYFNGDKKLGETRAEPHVLTLAGLPAGLYELSAKATDDGGASTSTPVSLLRLNANDTPSPTTLITVATLGKCATAYGSSAANSWACITGSTPTGTITEGGSGSCAMTVSDKGLMVLTAAEQQYKIDVPALKAGERNFTKTSTGLSFDYGPANPAGAAVRMRGRTVDQVAGKFFKQGGSLLVELRRAPPTASLSCNIPLTLN